MKTGVHRFQGVIMKILSPDAQDFIRFFVIGLRPTFMTALEKRITKINKNAVFLEVPFLVTVRQNNNSNAMPRQLHNLIKRTTSLHQDLFCYHPYFPLVSCLLKFLSPFAFSRASSVLAANITSEFI